MSSIPSISAQPSSFSELPQECIRTIYSFLSLTDVHAASQCSSALRTAAKEYNKEYSIVHKVQIVVQALKESMKQHEPTFSTKINRYISRFFNFDDSNGFSKAFKRFQKLSSDMVNKPLSFHVPFSKTGEILPPEQKDQIHCYALVTADWNLKNNSSASKTVAKVTSKAIEIIHTLIEKLLDGTQFAFRKLETALATITPTSPILRKIFRVATLIGIKIPLFTVPLTLIFTGTCVRFALLYLSFKAVNRLRRIEMPTPQSEWKGSFDEKKINIEVINTNAFETFSHSKRYYQLFRRTMSSVADVSKEVEAHIQQESKDIVSLVLNKYNNKDT